MRSRRDAGWLLRAAAVLIGIGVIARLLGVAWPVGPTWRAPSPDFLLAGALALLAMAELWRWPGLAARVPRTASTAAALGLLAIGLWHCVRDLLGLPPELLAAAVPGGDPGAIGTAVVTGWNMTLLAAALLLGSASRLRAWASTIAVACVGVLATGGAIGASFGLSHFFEMPPYRGGGALVSLPLMLLAWAAALRHSRGPLARVLDAPGAGAALARRVLPVVMLVPWAAAMVVVAVVRTTGEDPLWLLALTTSATIMMLLSVVLRQASEELRMEAHAEQMLHSIGDGVIAVDANSRVMRVNPVAAELTGWPAHEAVGRPLAEVFHIVNEATRAPAVDPVGRALREGVVVGLANHTALIARDGRECSIADSCAPVRDEFDRITGAILVFRDQSAEHAAERANTRAQAQLDCAPMSIALLDAKGVITHVNRAWRAFGEANDAHPTTVAGVGQDYVGVCRAAGAADADSVADALESLLSGQRSEWQGTYSCHSPRELRWFRCELRRLAGDDVAVAVMHTNITEQVQAEQRLALQSRAAAWLTEDVSCADAAHRLLEAAGALLAWDEAEMWTLAPTSFRRVAAWRAVGPCAERPAAPESDWLEACRGAAVATFAAGRPLWFGEPGVAADVPAPDVLKAHGFQAGLCVVVAEHAGAGGDTGVALCFATRIARAKDDAIVMLLQDIARQIGLAAERRALSGQVMQMERMASMGMLAAGVAHELNNPLAAVVANLDMAQESAARVIAQAPDAVGLQLELTEATRAAERLQAIVKDLKLFSRGDGEELAPLDVREVLESSMRLTWNEVRHRARLDRDLQDVPMIEGNASRLGQVFLNIIVNAAQAIPEGQADRHRVSVRSRVVGAQVAIEVSDTGSGMTPDVRARLFDPFFTTKPIGHGTGLGLSICKRIVDAHGGKIEVESEPGMGSMFRILLPIADMRATPQPEAWPQTPGIALSAAEVVPFAAPTRRSSAVELRPPHNITPGQGQPAVPRSGHLDTPMGGRVLIVDDEEPLGNLLRRLLGRQHDCTAVTSATSALALLRGGQRYDVILCDLMMPEMTGPDLHAALARELPDQAAAMVFLTGGAFSPAAQEFLDNVPNLCIDKPFDNRQVRAIVFDRVAQRRR